MASSRTGSKGRRRGELAAPFKRGSPDAVITATPTACNKDVNPPATTDSGLQDAKIGAKPAEAVIKPAAAPDATGNNASQDKKTQKRRPAVEKPKQEKKSKKDPNEPKRPPSAFFLFMEDFRKTRKEANPNAKGAHAVAKEGGDKWKSMSVEAKEAYVKKAAALKDDYAKSLAEYQSNDGKIEEKKSGSHPESMESVITDIAEEKQDGLEDNSRSAESVNETDE